MVPHVHGDLCDFATNPRYGRFRQACVPRSWFKTWVLTVGKSIWLTLPDEEGLFKSIYPYKGADVRILIASYTVDLAAKMVNKIKSEWMNNDRLKAAFPELIPDFNKTRWADSCAEVRRRLSATEGTYTAIGVGGSVVSQHFDHIIEDDLIYAKKDDFTGMELMPNQEDIDKAIGWHKLTHSLFVHPQVSSIDNVGTRWAPHDLVDYIRKNESQYQCFEITATEDSSWPIYDDTSCVWPERFNKVVLDQLRDSQGAKIFECFPAQAPILMSDWSMKPISEIVVGDEVVGIAQGYGKYKSCLTKATVNLVESMEKEVVKITLESGKVICCTADHPWYTGRTDQTHKPYLPARIGGRLMSVYDVKELTNEQLRDYRYLAGLVDGEGACKHGSIAIGQSKYANPEVYAGIINVVERLGIPYKVSTVNPNETHVLRNKVIARGLAQAIVLGGGRQVKGDLIRFGKPAKSSQILNTIWKRASHPIRGTDKVVSIEPDDVQTVYAIGTTTGNYVAYGFATKNTQYLNRPRAGEDVTFDATLVNRHDDLSSYPRSQYVTIVDLASWKETKKICNNVILTGCKDQRNHLWIARVDAGHYTPSEVIDRIKLHQKQFNSRVRVEEVGYQIALRHFARKDMESSVDSQVYNIDPLPSDNRKGAKDLRIQALEPVVRQGMLHCLHSHKGFIGELEDYPYSATKDILDCVGFLWRHSAPLAQIIEDKDPAPFTFEGIMRDLEEKSNSVHALPFDIQLGGLI